MNHKVRFCMAAVVMLVAYPAYAIHLDFYQVDWMADSSSGATYVSQDSDWGRVEITLTSTDHGLFAPMTLADGATGWGGFINVVTDSTGVDDWDIYNLPIFYENPLELNGRMPQGVLFDLGVGSGVDVWTLNYGFTVDPTPQLTTGPLPTASSMAAAVNPFEILNGGDKYYMFGSLVESGGVNAPQPAQDFPGAEAGEVIANHSSISVPETSVAGVNEDVNGCAPGAVARSIKYMSDSSPNVNVPDSADTVYGELKAGMGTTNKGTSTPGILHGKNHYVMAHNLPITSTQTQSFKAAMDTLKNGGDVEAGMNWGTDADGDSLGAHRAFVSEIQELQGADGNTTGYVVETVDDAVQGDGSTATATHTAKFDANGNLVQYDGQPPLGAGGYLINFQIENIHASTVDLEFPWGNSFTYRVPPGGYVPTPSGSIPVGRPGEPISIGGVRIRFGEGSSPNTELVVNPLAEEQMGDTLKMNLDVLDPTEPGLLMVHLGLDHVRPDELPGELLPALSGEDELFLENIIIGSSFFDITYKVNTDMESFEDGDGYQFFRLHGEIAEPFLESVWLLGMEEVALPPPDPDFPAESFFDVFLYVEITPEALPLLLEPGPATLFNMGLTAVEIPDLIVGDANGDGFVDEHDAAALAENWLRMDGEATWADGDFSGDGCVNDVDATMLAANWLRSSLPLQASAPEPATIMLLVCGGLCLLIRGLRFTAI